MSGFNKEEFLRGMAEEDSRERPAAGSAAERALERIKRGLMIHYLYSAIAILLVLLLLNGVANNGPGVLPIVAVLILSAYPFATYLIYRNYSIAAAACLFCVNLLAFITSLSGLSSSQGLAGTGLGLSAVGIYLSALCLIGTVQLRDSRR